MTKNPAPTRLHVAWDLEFIPITARQKNKLLKRNLIYKGDAENAPGAYYPEEGVSLGDIRVALAADLF